MKKDPALAFLNEVSSVPLKQALRHQQQAFAAFFKKRSCYPRFKWVAVIGRWYPSSKTCSACGHLLTALSLGTRHWTCPVCGTRHDRDVNAAKNILAAGLAADACGGSVRRAGVTRAQPPAKQESRPAREGIPAH